MTMEFPLSHRLETIDSEKFKIIYQSDDCVCAVRHEPAGEKGLPITQLLVNSNQQGLNLLRLHLSITDQRREQIVKEFGEIVNIGGNPVSYIESLTFRAEGALKRLEYLPNLLNRAAELAELVEDFTSHPFIGHTLALEALLLADPKHFRHEIFDLEGIKSIYPELTERGPQMVSRKVTDPSGASATLYLDSSSGEPLALCSYQLGEGGISSTNSRVLEQVKSSYTIDPAVGKPFPTMIEYGATDGGEVFRIVLHPNRFPLYAEVLSKAESAELSERHLAEQQKKIDLKILMANDAALLGVKELSKARVVSRMAGPNLRATRCADHLDQPFTAYRHDDGSWIGISAGQSAQGEAFVTQNTVVIGKIVELANAAFSKQQPRATQTEKVQLLLANGRMVEALYDRNYGYVLCAKEID